MNNHESVLPASSARLSLAFLWTALGSLAVGLGLLLIRPDALSGDPHRPEVLALTHLLTLGWVSSILFGVVYSLIPLTASSRLKSVPLAWVHLFFHVQGLILMVLGFFETPFAEVSHGGTFVFIGLLLFFLNLFLTASKLNRWDPANITIQCGLFWLLLSGGTGVLLFLNQHLEVIQRDPLWMIGIHAHFGLVGFVWLTLLGAALKVATMFVISDRRPGWSTWGGLILINAGMMAWVPAALLPELNLQPLLIGTILAGSVLYIADLVRLSLSAPGLPRADGLLILSGFVSALAILGWIAVGSPLPGGMAVETPEWIRIYFTLSILGPVTFIIFGLGFRLGPFLRNQIRLVEDRGPVLPLSGSSEVIAMVILSCLVLGFGYLIAAQVMDQAVGVSFTAVCYLVATGWFVWQLIVSGNRSSNHDSSKEYKN